MAILLYKCLISLCCREFLELLTKSFSQQLQFCTVHTLIVNLIQGIKLFLKLVVLLVCLHSRCREVQILRMKCKSGIGIIRI